MRSTKTLDIFYEGTPQFINATSRIGQSQDLYVASFHGIIDDVRIYNRTLSSTEIGDLFAFESINPVREPAEYGILACGFLTLIVFFQKRQKVAA